MVEGFSLVGVMTYEGQVAGVPDAVPTQRAKSLVVRRLKAASMTQLADRRGAIAGFDQQFAACCRQLLAWVGRRFVVGGR